MTIHSLVPLQICNKKGTIRAFTDLAISKRQRRRVEI